LGSWDVRSYSLRFESVRYRLKKKLEAPAAQASEFDLADDLEIDLVLAEPQIQQPLHMSFDERGRLWVVEYIQYPDPAGIKAVSRDKVWRVIYDKVPPPPPHAEDSPFRGKDKITIHEDTNGDGNFDSHKVFAEGLNLATSVAHGRGGVWVTNPPYLLFYPDADRDDVPDGPPVVHLSGFGLEDTHSIASSLYWGPDGWLYGAQGSTVSGAVLRPGIDRGDADAVKTMGQNVWHYHPERRIYEVFAEGGGNTFGVEIDSKGRVYSGHNGGDTRGFHYVQGGYYQKSFGKHGELTNPHSYGYFPAMKNAKVARFVHQFIIYESDGLPERYRGKLLGVDVLHNNIVMSEISPLGSTFETRDLGRPIATKDKMFRPVHIVEAPDGSVFIADWYDTQVNHYKNHEGQIDHKKGRIYRVRPKGKKPGIAPLDMGSLGSEVLVAYLQSPSRWERQTAQRLIADRREPELIKGLRELALGETGTVALEALWALSSCDGMDDEIGLQLLRHEDPHVRLWAVRLLGDAGFFGKSIADEVLKLARYEEHVEVLSQIACTAKRVQAREGLMIAKELAMREETVPSHWSDQMQDLLTDPHLPLLIWWAVEARCEEHPDQVVAVLLDGLANPEPNAGLHRVAKNAMRRFASSGKQEDLQRCAEIFTAAKGRKKHQREMLESMLEAFEGRSLEDLPKQLEKAIVEMGGVASLAFRIRRGEGDAIDEALEQFIEGKITNTEKRTLIAAFDEAGFEGEDRDALVLQLFGLFEMRSLKKEPGIRAEIVATVGNFDNSAVSDFILGKYERVAEEVRVAMLDVLTSRIPWAIDLLERVERDGAFGGINRSDISLAHIEKLKQLGDAGITARVKKLWPDSGEVGRDKSDAEMARVKKILAAERGVPKTGEALYAQRCASCHTMFNKGGAIGPDLTSYQKNDLDTMLLSIIAPSAEIREGFEQAVVKKKDGAVHTGFLVDQNDNLIALRELSGTRRTVKRVDIQDLEIIGTSLMPPGLLTGLDEKQLRDLFAYLRSTTPPF